MESYNNYGFNEFLSDLNFREWVKHGCSKNHPVWPQFLSFFPEKREDFQLAIDVLKDLYDERIEVTQAELDSEVARILSTTQPRRRSIRLSRHWYGVAAAFLIGVMAWYFIQPVEKTPIAYQALKKQDPVSTREFRNDSDSIRSIMLPDGSLALLHPQAALTFLKEGFEVEKQSTRDVYITGDVFFDVAPDKNRPFLVYTDKFVTTVVGTSFLIRSSDVSPSVEVKTGKVIVRSLSLDNDWEVALTPNQKVVYSVNENKIVRELADEPVMLPDHEEILDFQFDNAPISEVFASLEKAYGIPIHFDSVTISSCAISVHMGEEVFLEKLSIICETIGANYTIANGEVWVSGPGCR